MIASDSSGRQAAKSSKNTPRAKRCRTAKLVPKKPCGAQIWRYNCGLDESGRTGSRPDSKQPRRQETEGDTANPGIAGPV